jgi:hypothetical protein
VEVTVQAPRSRNTVRDAPDQETALVPQDGDVVVARESRSAVACTVRQHPGDIQFIASPRDEAVRLARTFAQAHAVDVWYAEDGTSHRLLEVYRPRTDS